MHSKIFILYKKFKINDSWILGKKIHFGFSFILTIYAHARVVRIRYLFTNLLELCWNDGNCEMITNLQNISWENNKILNSSMLNEINDSYKNFENRYTSGLLFSK